MAGAQSFAAWTGAEIRTAQPPGSSARWAPAIWRPAAQRPRRRTFSMARFWRPGDAPGFRRPTGFRQPAGFQQPATLALQVNNSHEHTRRLHAFIRAYKAGVTAGVKGQPAVRIAELGSGVRETTTDPTATATAVAVSHAPVEDAGQDNTAAMTKPPRPHTFCAAAEADDFEFPCAAAAAFQFGIVHAHGHFARCGGGRIANFGRHGGFRADRSATSSAMRRLSARNFGNVGNGLRAVPLESRLQPAANSLKAGLQPARNAAEEIPYSEHEESQSSKSQSTKPDGPAARPTFEVDRFAWPEICNQWIRRAAEPVDQLVQGLLAEAALGRKIIAITGCWLAAKDARRRHCCSLGGWPPPAPRCWRSMPISSSPQLASRLGMAIESGWEQSLAAPDGVSPWETMIESLDDRLTIAPLAPRTRLNVTVDD